jgi:hypothetical protein
MNSLLRKPGRTGGTSGGDELASRYGLTRPPELTPEIAARRWRELNRLVHACMVLHGVGRDRRPFQRLLRTTGALVGASRGVFYVSAGCGQEMEIAAASGYLRAVPERLRTGNLIASAAITAGKPLLVHRPAEAPVAEEMRLLGESSCVAIPILREGQRWGVIQLMRPEAFCEDEAVLLWMYALIVEDALPSLATAARSSEVAPEGPSGLVSPSVFATRLDWELECVLWGGRSSTLLRIARVTAAGTEQGEAALQRPNVLRIVRGCLRSVDLVSPGNGGELMVFLPEMDAREAQLIAQKIRRSLVQSRALGEESDVIPSLRIASATCPEQGRRREDLFRTLLSQA